MEKIIDKVNKLIKLATNNPSEQEAKLAALKACILIENNELKIIGNGKHPNLDIPDFGDFSYGDMFRERQQQQRANRTEAEKQARRRREAEIKEAIREEKHRQEEGEKKRKEWAQKATMKRIILKHDTFCKYCRKNMIVGDIAMWTVGGTGIFHPECWDKYKT